MVVDLHLQPCFLDDSGPNLRLARRLLSSFIFAALAAAVEVVFSARSSDIILLTSSASSLGTYRFVRFVHIRSCSERFLLGNSGQ